MEEIPGGYLGQRPGQSWANFKVQWGCLGPHPFKFGKSWSMEMPKPLWGCSSIQQPSWKTCLPSHGCLIAQTLPEPPLWPFTPLLFHSPLVMAVPSFLHFVLLFLPLFSAFGLVSFSQGWKMHPGLQTTARDFCAEIYKLSISLWMLWMWVGFFLSPKLLGKKATIWWMSITYHPFLMFSSTP